MALSVTRARVKEKCGISGTTYDSTIDNLISEMAAVIEHFVRPEHIADTGNTGLQATLNLGATEIVCGEFLDQLSREPGALEKIVLGDLELEPAHGPAFFIRKQGWGRLRPYLKFDPAESSTKVKAAKGKAPASQPELPL
jgi:hypothetical protein